MLSVSDRELVFPGKLIGSDIFYDGNCFIEGGNVYSAVDGMVRVDGKRVRVVPSSGGYTPKVNDVIVGVVINAMLSRWLIDIGSPYICSLAAEEISRNADKRELANYFRIGDLVAAKIFHVNEVYSCQLSKPWKIEGGFVMDIDPKRVPRVVGKKKSMLNMIRDKTGSKIIVGQNGKIWLRDGNVDLAVKAIKRIEKYAQTRGLTDRMAQFLETESAKNPVQFNDVNKGDE